MAAKKVAKKASAKTKAAITAQTVKHNCTVFLSDGGRTTCGRGTGGLTTRVGDVYTKLKDGTYKKK